MTTLFYESEKESEKVLNAVFFAFHGSEFGWEFQTFNSIIFFY